MATILVASRNSKKLVELQRIVGNAGISGLNIIGLNEVSEFPETPETGARFVDNARVKAIDGLRATGFACLADDSGLEVVALNGMPGVLSARWAGEHGNDAANNALLLAQLVDVPEERRHAAFVSACVLALPDGAVVEVEGRWPGIIGREAKGQNGFGYDPLFYPLDAAGRSSAQLSSAEKDAASHRGRALAQLLTVLAELAKT